MKKLISYILAILSGILVLGIDQYTKALVAKTFSLGEEKEFLKGLIDFVYVKNAGGAWGFLSGKTWVLLIFTVLVMMVCVFIIVKYGKNNKLLFWAISLVLFGGIGNMIDRVFRGGFVVDFLHFEFWPQFPVFNIADCGIVIGTGLLILYFVLDMINDYKFQKDESVSDNGEN